MQDGTVTTALFDESIHAALRAEHPDEEKRAQLRELGLPTTLLSAVALALTLKAAAGDVSAAKFIKDACGEKSTDSSGPDLSTLTDEDLRAVIRHFEEEIHDTREENR